MAKNKMEVMPVGKLIFEMSLPPLFSMFLQYSYNLLDSAFVARLSENALTAVSLSFPITKVFSRQWVLKELLRQQFWDILFQWFWHLSINSHNN